MKWLTLIFVISSLASGPGVSFEGSSNLSELRLKFKRPVEIPFPEANPFTSEKFYLGKKLFFDPKLSRSEDLACSSCHNPGLSWSDGLARARGLGQKELKRKTPSILNAAWGSTFFWDGRASSLEEQALGPIQAPEEMGMDLKTLEERLSQLGEYRLQFEKAFGSPLVTRQRIAEAIATFERVVVSPSSSFERWVEGDENALNEDAKKGFAVFNGKASCVNCHTGWRFTNGSFADVGLLTKDRGKGDFLFKTPSLIGIAERAPYMHDGSIQSLEEVVEHYNRGGTVKRKLTRLFLKPLYLTKNEKTQLIAFLKSLNINDVPQGGNLWDLKKRQLASE